jgi:predicted RNase H-like HicB family nuclease
MMIQHYGIVIFYSEDDEGFIAVVPELPGSSAFGETEEEALREVKVAVETVATDILAETALATAMGGDPVRDYDHESYSCQLKCHDTSGEIYYVTFGRDNVRITSYEDDAIRTAVETWADTVAALA